MREDTWLANNESNGRSSINRRQGGKLARSETVTVRLDPKLRYLAELAGRKQRRSLSSFIEWAVQNSLSAVMISEGGYEQAPRSVADVANELWDVDEAERFLKLAIRCPDTLSHVEQILWKLIRECGYLWRGGYSTVTDVWTWRIREESIVTDRLREHWETFKSVARGEADKSALPDWPKRRISPKDTDSGPGPDDMPSARRDDDEDIPF
jgi:hypothetical protein